MKIKTLVVSFLIAGALFSSQPTSCAATGPGRAFAAAAVMLQPAVCEAGVMDQLCSHVTSFLDDEAAKAGADLKNCKKNCLWKKNKNDLITAAKKKAKESCSKGQAPVINDVNKGLDTDAKTRLKDLYNRNSRMFDGTAKLPDKDFEPAPSKQTAALTGKGGGVADLKAYEPAIPKLGRATEFSLSGTKLSGDTSNPATIKQSATLLSSISSGKASTDTASALVSRNSATLLNAKASAASAAKIDPGFAGCWCYISASSQPFIYGGPGTNFPDLTSCQAECCRRYKANCVPGGGGGLLDWLKNLWHKLKGEEKCGKTWHNPDKTCCANGTVVAKCGDECYNPTTECCIDGKIVEKQKCTAGSTIKIEGLSDLILHKPSENSKTLSLQATISCPCPEKIQWTASSNKIRFVGATNQQSVQIMPVSESGIKDDISVTVTVDGITSEPKKLTVRRPKFLSHSQPLPFKKITSWVNVYGLGTYDFWWTLTDQLGDPMPNIAGKEEVRKSPGSSLKVLWYHTIERNWRSLSKGEISDYYMIVVYLPFDDPEFRCYARQTHIVNGYTGDSNILITIVDVIGTSPVVLK